jgi:bifunctional non-homologous end joining protein LigD
MAKIRMGKYTVETTHEDIILFPRAGLTKKDLVDYYVRIAPIMLPYLKNRPISMQRFPNGISDESFYQKDAPDYFPSFIKRAPIAKKEDGHVNYVVCNNEATIAYLANQACIVIHIWLSRIDKINYPDRMIFDLDPSGNNFKDIQKAALLFHDFLSELGLASFAMTTGSRGIHVVVPLKRQHSFEQVRSCAQQIGMLFVQKYPRMFTMEIHKEKRANRIFIDTLRNAFGQTGVAPYSVRATPFASIATPLHWHEVGSPKLKPTLYTIKNIWERLDTIQDPWHLIDKHACTLTKACAMVQKIGKTTYNKNT